MPHIQERTALKKFPWPFARRVQSSRPALARVLNSHIKYRREIDGLRALAVLPVILFHAGLQPFSGGFVGVDVFFVISGYLITTIILIEKEAGKFTLLGFYDRRLRRLLPVLFLVMISCLPFAWLWMLPSELKDFSASLVGVSLFSSNILFWAESGYFEPAAELKPLLHTWSLAVEEQYYVLFPLFIFLTWKLGKQRMVALAALGWVASLTIAQWGSAHQPTAAFFFLPTRGWELLTGALTAFYLLEKKTETIAKNPTQQLLSLTGLVCIGLAIALYDKATPFPGINALLPTAGTALIILFAVPDTWVGKLLGSKSLVGVGLISYSAYLWHQPLFAFARLRSISQPSAKVYLLLAATSLILAFISWKYVELPFRDKSLVSRSTLFKAAIAMSAIVIGIGLTGYFNNGFDRLRATGESTYAELDRRIRADHGLDAVCDKSFTTSTKCRTSVTPEIIVWGDSFAMHLVPGLLASKPDAKIVQMTKSVCAPILGLAPVFSADYNREWAQGCIEFNRQVFDWLMQNRTVKYALLSSAFDRYADGDSQLLTAAGMQEFDQQLIVDNFTSTLDLLTTNGITPVVFSPTPQNGNQIGRCLARSRYLGLNIDQCDFSLSVDSPRQLAINDFLKKIGRRHEIVWLSDGICEKGRCAASAGDILIYRDNGHLSYEGSAFIGKKMDFYHRIVSAPGQPR